jgi:hypothetical protein
VWSNKSTVEGARRGLVIIKGQGEMGEDSVAESFQDYSAAEEKAQT